MTSHSPKQPEFTLSGYLPETISWMPDIIGGDNAVKVALLYAGRYLRFPAASKLHDSHPLVIAIGMDAANTLVKHCHGEAIEFGACAELKRKLRDMEIVRKYMEGMYINVIAHEMGVSRRTVGLVLKKAKAKREEDQA